MPLRRTLTLVAITGFLVASPNFAEAHCAAPNEIAPCSEQESNPSTQTQGRQSSADGVEKAGPDVSSPILIHSVEPKASKAIRKSKDHGIVLINLYIEANGSPSNAHVIRIRLYDRGGKEISSPETTPEGADLGRAAVDAVNRYRFKPALKHGVPVKVELNIEVNYQFL